MIQKVLKVHLLILQMILFNKEINLISIVVLFILIINDLFYFFIIKIFKNEKNYLRFYMYLSL